MDPVNTTVAIVGAGPGGLSAGLWCRELGLDHIVIEAGREAGGQLLWTFNEIDNYIGLNAANGKELRDRFVSHAARHGVNIRYNSRCSGFDPEAMALTLEDGGSITATAIIIATGVSRRLPDAEGYDRFVGKGVLHSGKRDKALAARKPAVVVGGGDAAFENALILSETASSVTLVHRREIFTAREEFVREVADRSVIRVLTNRRVAALDGDEALETVSLEDLVTGEVSSIPAGAIVFRIGVAPNSGIFSGSLATDKRGYLLVDSEGRTNLAGIYAVGDISNPVSPTISTSVGTGATAAKSAYLWLRQTSDIQSFE